MTNMKKLITMMLMLASVFFFACSEDEEDKMSKEEAKTEITQLGTDISDKFTDMQESDGMVAMDALLTLDYPFSENKSNKGSAVLKNIQKYLLPYNYVGENNLKSASNDEMFDFDRWVGTYTWNNTVGAWDPDYGTPEDKIIIIFPADTADMDNNNATLTISNYSEVTIDEDFYPESIDVELMVSEIKVIDIDFDAEWFETGDYMGEPTSLDVSVYLIPFEFTGSFTHTSTEADIDVSILYDSAEFFTIGLGADWANEGDSIPSNINGYISFFNVKFQADVDLADIIDLMLNTPDNITTQDELIEAVNNEIDAYVSVDGTWAADIEITVLESTDEDGEMFDILFVYADGTSESAIPYFEELGEELEEFFGALEEYYDSW